MDIFLHKEGTYLSSSVAQQLTEADLEIKIKDGNIKGESFYIAFSGQALTLEMHGLENCAGSSYDSQYKILKKIVEATDTENLTNGMNEPVFEELAKKPPLKLVSND